MKKIILSLAVAAMSFAASAQTSAGTMMFGGELGFQSYTPKGGSANSAFGLGLNGGYFLQDKLAVMVGIGFEGEDKGGVRSGLKSGLNFNLGAQKYWELASGFYLTGGAGFGYFSQTDLLDNKNSGFGISVTPGFTWFPTANWGISMNTAPWLYFNSSDAGSGWGLNPNVSGLGLGVAYYMGK